MARAAFLCILCIAAIAAFFEKLPALAADSSCGANDESDVANYLQVGAITEHNSDEDAGNDHLTDSTEEEIDRTSGHRRRRSVITVANQHISQSTVQNIPQAAALHILPFGAFPSSSVECLTCYCPAGQDQLRCLQTCNCCGSASEVAANVATGYCDGVTCPTAVAVSASFNKARLLQESSQPAPPEDCVNPAHLEPGPWNCNCKEAADAICTDASTRAACYKDLMCRDARIAQEWKDDECSGYTEAGCTPRRALVTLNDTLEDQSDKAADSDAFDTRSMDESLSGKRTAGTCG